MTPAPLRNHVQANEPVVIVYPTKGVSIMTFSEALKEQYRWENEVRIFTRDFAQSHLEELEQCSPEWMDFIKACRTAWPQEFVSVA